jgi:Ca2+-binding RTX toxin-like protein
MPATNGNDIIDGTIGNDRLEGLGGNDTLNGFDGNDELIGDSLNPRLVLFGNDLLNGGLGNDTMRGGRGNDTYIVDSVGDSVLENLNEGFDIVQSSVSFNLGANVERLVLTGVASINGTGNTLDNSIVGNSGNNILNGGDGNDFLDGGLGNDSLNGGAGNDVLEGGGGNDVLNGGLGTNTLRGGLGNDIYVFNLFGTNNITDIGGVDTLQSVFSTTLNADLENLTLLGFGSINGTGNALNNIINGNSAANTLNGLAGNDTVNGNAGNDVLFGSLGNDFLNGGLGADRMDGGVGNDTYIVDSLGDVVIELPGLLGGGVDTVQSSVSTTLSERVENLTLVGTAASGTGNDEANLMLGNAIANTLDGKLGNDTLVGNGGDDLLIGGAGGDLLLGGVGNDTLDGGSGADSYLFNSAVPFNVAALGIDVIKNFTSGFDKIVLDQTTFGPLVAANIAIVANDAVAATSAARISYSSATGRLFFNQNGAGAGFGTGGQFASTNAAPAVAVTDFQIVA